VHRCVRTDSISTTVCGSMYKLVRRFAPTNRVAFVLVPKRDDRLLCAVHITYPSEVESLNEFVRLIC